MSKPQAIISLAFSNASLWTSSASRSFQRNFSSSVNWITNGTSNASCKYLGKIHVAAYFIPEFEYTLWKEMESGDQGAWILKMGLYRCTGRMVVSARRHPKLDRALCGKRKRPFAEMDAQACQCIFQCAQPDHCLFSDCQIDLQNYNHEHRLYIPLIYVMSNLHARGCSRYIAEGDTYVYV